MAELTQKERLQPSLLDRLADDDVASTMEARDKRILTFQKLRDLVMRDLAWLLNCESMGNLVDLDDLPHVKTSVLNYGIPVLSGQTLSGMDIIDLERQLKEAIRLFEPRILADTIEVRATVTSSMMSNNALEIDIEGELWAQPIPLRLFLRTEVDLDIGSITVKVVN